MSRKKKQEEIIGKKEELLPVESKQDKQRPQNFESNKPIMKWGMGLIQLTLWPNIDEKTGNEWHNFLLKIGRKDKKSGEWKNESIRFGTHQVMEIREYLDSAVKFCYDKNIR